MVSGKAYRTVESSLTTSASILKTAKILSSPATGHLRPHLTRILYTSQESSDVRKAAAQSIAQ